jgi:DNA-binding NarL/FixJ family response regulator
VVLDLAMPGINGIEAAHRMSILDPHVPLILFTLCDIEEIKPVARRAGIYATVSKERTLELVDTIESAIEERSSAGQNMQ